ncbi:helix-turn-helix domain-containing protein [Candidatus Gottesmanbacteria bacterium]|nr:helix-turn-helix domain-containing protein [Candidatus Gottesmanbacteria bacterium]
MADSNASPNQYPLPERFYEKLAERLYEPLTLSENAVILCPPLWGRDHNIRILWERAAADRRRILKRQANRYTFSHHDVFGDDEHALTGQFLAGLDLPVTGNANFSTLASGIHGCLKDGVHPVFFLNISESLTDEALCRVLNLAQRTYYLAPNHIHFIIVMDMKWNEDDFFMLVAPFRSLFQNIIRPTVYTDEETLHLISYWLNRWQYRLSRQAKDWLARSAGGILLLGKAATRLAVKEKLKREEEIRAIVPTHPDFTVQMRLFLARLTNEQHTILARIANNERLHDDGELRHLEAMGFLRQTSSGWEIGSSFIARYLTTPARSTRRLKAAVLASKSFSEREKLVVTTLVALHGTPLNRDRLAQIIWGEEEYLDKFSDWALDQAMSRIRRKLHTIPKLQALELVSVKKHGFQIL